MRNFIRLGLTLGIVCELAAAPGAAPYCDPVTGCPAAITATTYMGRPAYRLTDGRIDAVVVPSLGRVMQFGLVNGPNILWNSPGPWKPDEWRNWGGDKTWLAPESLWAVTTGNAWPPDPAWDGRRFTSEVLTGGGLRLTGTLAKVGGTRIIRDMFFNDQGEFVIRQVVKKERGGAIPLSIWSVTQIVPPDAVFLPQNPHSHYKDNFHNYSMPLGSTSVSAAGDKMLKLVPATAGDYKMGVDSAMASIVALRGRQAFVERAACPSGKYPDGAEAAGFPVEVFNRGVKAGAPTQQRYMELELLSPLATAEAGSRWVYTVRWSIHEVPPGGPDAPEVRAAVQLLMDPPAALPHRTVGAGPR